MKVFVYIATTQGPVLVRKITQEDDDVQSVVCLNHSADRLPISSRYHDFVKKGTGVVHRDFGHGAFRLDLEHRVTAGDSWQLAVYLAHALHAQGVLLDLGSTEAAAPGAGDLVVWGTGAVSADRLVGRVEAVQEKLEKSRHLFESCTDAGAKVVVALPAENRDDVAALQLQAWMPNDVLLLRSTSEAMSFIDMLLPAAHRSAAAATGPVVTPTDKRGSAGGQAAPSTGAGKMPLWFGLGGAAVIGLALFVWLKEAPAPKPDIELDDFGGQPARPGMSESALHERVSAPPVVDVADGVKLALANAQLVVERGATSGDCAEAGTSTETAVFRGDTTVALAGLCRFGLRLDDENFAVIAIADDVATRVPVSVEAKDDMHWVPVPSDQKRDRVLTVIVLPKDDLRAYGNRIDAELRRLRFAEFDVNLQKQVQRSLKKMADGYRLARVTMTVE